MIFNDTIEVSTGTGTGTCTSYSRLGCGRRSSDDDHSGAKVVGVELEDFEARRVDESAHVPVPPAPPLGSVLRGLKKKLDSMKMKKNGNTISLFKQK